MGTVFIICFACLFLIPGLLIALLNWANISIWVWEKWQNPRSKAETCIAPFLGGLFLTSGSGTSSSSRPLSAFVLTSAFMVQMIVLSPG